MMKTKVLLALLLTSGTAQASEWVSIGTTDNAQIEYFVDVSSIRVESDIRRGWVKTVFASHTVRGPFRGCEQVDGLRDDPPGIQLRRGGIQI
jgi:hypothetical protein